MLYNLIFYLYEFGIFVAHFFSDKIDKMWKGERAAFSVLKEKVEPNAQYVWFHAASLGEFEQGRPIIEEYRRRHPEHKILLTFFSPSGYEVRKNYEGADIICYLPIDTFTNARRFLRAVRPVKAFFIKYEFWFNYLHILKHRNVPTYSVSSIFRKDQIFFKWYGFQYRHVLRCFTRFYVQNEESRELLASLGINNADVIGDTRFDRVVQIAKQSKTLEIIDTFKNGKKAFIAGSSWQPDEEIFIPYFAEKQDWKLIIAPHVIAESHLQQIMQLLSGRKVVRYTEVENECKQLNATGIAEASSIKQKLQEADAIIIDCFGLLSSIYKYGDVAYVGGGFGVGIHNLPEAAVWYKPVIFGPNNERFQEAQDLKACKGGFEIDGAEAFKQIMDGFIGQPDTLEAAAEAAGMYVNSHAGATNKLLGQVEQ